MNNTQDFFAHLSDLESGAADLTQAQHVACNAPCPPRQRVDIVMCDLLAAWWVKRMLAREKASRGGRQT
jgi:hypothetical protein